MLTKEKLNIYRKYSGDIDSWARFGKKNELELINDDEWKLIDDLVQSLELIKNKATSEKFKIQTLEKLLEVCEDEKTQKELKSLIGKYGFTKF